MSYDEHTLSQFDKYTEGKMTEEEKTVFEIALKENEILDKSFQDYLHLKAGIREFGYLRFSDKLKSWESELSAEHETKVITINKRWYLVAAAVTFLILSVIGLSRYGGTATEQEMFASYYEPYPDIITNRGSGQQLLNKGLYEYESGNYEEAIAAIRAYLSDHREQNEVRFYLAQAYLANNETGKALDIFNILQEEENFKLKEANEWYTALTYLKLENKNTAKELLQQIQRNTNHAYRERSEKLLKVLN